MTDEHASRSFSTPSAFSFLPQTWPRTASERSPPASGRWRRRAAGEASPRTSRQRTKRSAGGKAEVYGSANVSSQSVNSPGSSVGRSKRDSKIDREAVPPQFRTVFLGRRKIPRVARGGVDAAAGERRFDRQANALDAAVASHLGHESPAAAERPFHPFQHGVGPFHPMQGRVAEDGVELLVEIEGLAILDAGIEPAFSGRFNLLGTRIDADDLAAQLDHFSGQRPVAAAQIENSLARLRIRAARRRRRRDRRRTARCGRNGLDPTFAQT